jgi:hypothetical protein
VVAPNPFEPPLHDQHSGSGNAKPALAHGTQDFPGNYGKHDIYLLKIRFRCV